jgi:glycosyltransferase involved in cell wall biosynthesis
MIARREIQEGGPHVVHAVASGGFAGVESYIATVAPMLPEFGWSVTVVGGESVTMRELLGEKIEHFPARTAVELFRVLRGIRPTIVHAHMTAAESAAVAAKPGHRARVVATRHFARPRGRNPPARAAGRFLASFIDAEVAISEFVRETIRGPAVVITNGVPNAEAGVHDQPTVLMAQRLEREKNTGLALEAWQQAELWRQGWRLEIAGAGSEDGSLRRLAESLGISDSVSFLGFRRDVAELRDRASIFLATAAAEPFGLAVVEAMASGMAVAATASGGHLETIGTVDRLLLFSPTDPSECAAVLKRLADDKNARTDIGRALQRRQREAYDIARHVTLLAGLYESVTNTAG